MTLPTDINIMLERVDIILSLPNISICICTGLILIVINYWIKDVIREYIKKYEVLIIMLFIVFLIFIFPLVQLISFHPLIITFNL